MRYRVVGMRDLDIIHPYSHRHVTSVVTGPAPGRRERNWTAGQLQEAVAGGDSFYTQSESTGEIAEIEIYTCDICGQEWIRTNERVVEDNKLESLPHANSDPPGREQVSA